MARDWTDIEQLWHVMQGDNAIIVAEYLVAISLFQEKKLNKT